MSNPEELKLKRHEYMKHLYELTDGNPTIEVNEATITRELGLPDEESESIYYYLEMKGLIESTAIGGLIAITDLGIDMVENTT